jgi:hypothetical protein
MNGEQSLLVPSDEAADLHSNMQRRSKLCIFSLTVLYGMIKDEGENTQRLSFIHRCERQQKHCVSELAREIWGIVLELKEEKELWKRSNDD